MGRHSVRQKEKFILWAISVMFLELIIIYRALGSGSCPFSNEVSSADHHHHHHHGDHSHEEINGIASDEDHSDHHGCGHSHFHDHDNDHHDHHHELDHIPKSFRLPEELKEEEDLRLHGFGYDYHDHEDHDHEHLSTTGLWLHAMGCSLLVSMASLICLMILPLILLQGKPSKTVVDLLAAFGAGAMLGDSFLHQLPHALGGSHNHSHTHSLDGHNHNHNHNHNHASIDSHEPSHSHSLEELSVGLAALAGILLFFLVEKVVRYVEEHSSQGVHGFHHGHHHHHKSNVASKKDEDRHGPSSTFIGQRESSDSDKAHESKSLDANADADTDTDVNCNAAEQKENLPEMMLRKRSKSTGANKFEKEFLNSSDVSSEIVETAAEPSMPSSASNMVIGYLNLFSDGVHNFTDGMALGSAFLLHGSVGGWSRTLFLLAHELPQEIGDFGILVGSGFTVFKALFFNFLSALVALAGTALALLIGKDTGHSSLIEGFTAGGFIYIAMVGVLPEMHHKGTSFKITLLQLISLMSGMGVALWISLIE